MSEHISSRFNEELENVRSEVMRMGGLAEQQLNGILAVMQHLETDAFTPIIDGDEALNDLEIQIDDACQTIIARRQPAAGDLRFVMTVIRIIVDLERIGDEIKKIALIGQDLAKHQRATSADLLGVARLARITQGMLRRALDAFARLDADVVIELTETDKILDHDYLSQLRSRITYMMEDPRSIGSNIDILFMARSVERIGDHAKNIAEHVVYLTKGIDVRHTSLEEIKKTIA
ncbi:phosphate signaling complex protein PhoU [Neisseria leonii]|uniref:phosphate signaling complex protein PhoU n=1 Tax=Neisseria leonii TaxID=2995413 RepID=UPI00237BF67F|nr:phosphate signaling complex protein PhoU [Neisseria sp. 3986]MDD9324859.1 phosphate signaling complex protein PhoU [Neisseria sp. 3986]